jgi:5'-3' exonuclease
MGIPSFFSYIIKQHSGVLVIGSKKPFARLYMDCNSILYDCYHSIPQSEPLDSIESILLERTGIQIEKYIRDIHPSQLVYIAFDGVAPVAKMEQQRTRRYKSWFETVLTNKIEQNPQHVADCTKTTSMFTPGTAFMEKLSRYMKTKFLGRESKYGVEQIIVATPDEPGEGEHKLYTHLRQHPTDEPCAIYGLDADLMMLSLFHISYCANMYIFREAPQFAQVLLLNNNTIDKNEPIFIDVAKLGRSISHEMRCGDPDPHRMHDYVFLCFLLGNDFLPHFPSLNIRTSGITVLLDTYRAVIGNKKGCFIVAKTTPPQIQWREFSHLVTELAKHEKDYICQEYAVRKRWDKIPPQLQPKKTPKMRLDLFQNTPVLYREKERFINPHEKGWEERYYQTLFAGCDNVHIETERKIDYIKQNVSVNYLEGLEWVFRYYLLGEVDWEWKYEYHYPPLLKDLCPFIPRHNSFFRFLPEKETRPVSAHAQLAYVLPPIYHHLLPVHLLKEEYKQYYDGYTLNHDGLPVLDFEWSFCRYFWESHIHLPRIPLDVLNEWN